MKIAVIGAGPAGLCALKTCLDENFNCDVFEKSGVIGGVWNYNEKIGIDEFGIPIHNSVYEELRYFFIILYNFIKDLDISFFFFFLEQTYQRN